MSERSPDEILAKRVKELTKECRDRAECEKSLTEWNEKLEQEVKKLWAENRALKDTEYELRADLKIAVKALEWGAYYQCVQLRVGGNMTCMESFPGKNGTWCRTCVIREALEKIGGKHEA